MMNNRNTSYTIVCIFIFSIIFIKNSKAQVDTINYIGSSTIGNFLIDAEKKYPNITFNLDTEPESTGGELAIVEGRTTFAGIARQPGLSKNNQSIISTLIGWDAISIIVNQSNPIQNLSQTQLKEIFTGKIKNWKALGGSDLPITPFIVNNESATRKVFRSIILGKDDYNSCKVISPDINILEKVKNTPGAIGQISYSFLSTLDNIKTINVNEQPLELTNNNYPVIRPLYLLWNDSEANRMFVNWVVSDKGQRIIMNRFIGIRESNISTDRIKGDLIVYTKTRVVEDGGIYYYPHESYDIFSTDYKLIAHIENHLSENDENPTKVNLPMGTYIIIPNRKEKKEHLITIQSNRTTKVNVDESFLFTKNDKPIQNKTINKLKVFKPYGDVRIRFEDDIKSNQNRFRQRFRARLGFNAIVNPDFQLSMRLSTSNNPNDPNSTHVDANDGFNQINIIFDRVYIHFNPKKLKAFNLWLGKFPNPLVSSKIFSEIVWDDDIQPEGAAFAYQSDWNDRSVTLKFVNGSYFLSQFKSDATKLWLNTSQISLKSNIRDNLSLSLGTGIYYYANIKDIQTQNTIFDQNQGNSFYFDEINPEIQRYKHNYYINQNFILITSKIGSKPIIFKGEYINNLGASENHVGWSTGISLGSLKNTNDWNFYYQYQSIEKDAIFSPFTNDDTLIQTDYKGHIFGVGYSITKKISLHSWALIHQSLSSTSEYKNRFRVDLNVKI